MGGALAGSLAASRPGFWQKLRYLRTVRVHPATLAILGMTLFAGVLRIFNLTSKDIWYDEAFIITLAKMPIPEMLSSLVALDPHPPLYYLFMHFWVMLGTDPLLTRLPSALFSALSVPLLYATGRRLAGRATSLIAAALLTVSSFHVEWAQETRMYALLSLICLGSTYFLIRSLQDGGGLNWIIFALLTAAALYTQLNAVFYVVAQGFAVVLLLARAKRSKRRGEELATGSGADSRGSSAQASPQLSRPIAIPWLLSQVGAAALFVPWLPSMLTQVRIYGDPGHTSTSLRAIEGIFFQFAFGHFPYYRLIPNPGIDPRDYLVVATLLLAALGAWSLRNELSRTLLPSLLLLTIIFLAIAGFWKAIVLPKTVIGATHAYYLMIAAGISLGNRKQVIIGGAILLLLFSSLGLAKYYTMGSREEWKKATQYLSAQLQPDEVVFVDSSAGLMPLNYYLDRPGKEAELYGLPFRHWAVSPPPLAGDDVARIDEISHGRPGCWLVIFRNDFKDHDGQAISHLADQYSLADARGFSKIRLFHFVPRGVEKSIGGTESDYIEQKADQPRERMAGSK